MIENATLSAVQAPNTADKRGEVTFAAATAVSARGALTEPSFSQKRELVGVLKDVSAVFYVLKTVLGNVSVQAGRRLTITLDGAAAVTYEVIKSVDREKAGGLSHWECWLKVMA